MIRYREFVKRNFEKYLTVIRGEGPIEEKDECRFGIRKYNKGHGVEGVWIVGLVNGQQKAGFSWCP